MSEERASRHRPPRRSEGAHEGSGGGQGPAAFTGGGGRRRAGAPEFGPAELAAALQDSVAAVGASGPPRAGIARIRRRAKARQRRRTVAAGSAGVLVLAMAVSVVTGNSFNIVPVLTGVVGLGGSDSGSERSAGPQDSGGVGQVRTVRPPAGSAGKKGPAIGPMGPTGVPSALAATGAPQCGPSDLTTVTTVDAVIGGVSYGHVEAVAQRVCAVAGPPVLRVENAAGTAAGTVVILQHVPSDGSQLPNVATWGTVLKLQPGQGYDFQFAWAPDACTGPGAGGSGPASATGGTGAPGAGQASQSAYTVSYLIGNVTPTEPVDLTAACGATVYVTDVYGHGGYPLPKPADSASPQPSASSAPATTPSPSTPSVSTPSATGSSAASPSGGASSSAAAGDSPAGTGQAASAADPPANP